MAERYTIREISRLTGLTAATLRKWEERYGVVNPVRLPNGYREYTATDLAALQWLADKLAGGALISTAAAELKAKLAAGWNPAAQSLKAPQDGAAPQQEGVAALRDRLVAALLNRSPGAVAAALDAALSAFSVETVLLDVVQAALYEIGRRWETGEISAYQEHYSSVLLRDRLISLRGLVGGGNGPLMVVACLPGELHEMGALILGLLAARQGFQVVHLGASPSAEGLKRMIGELRPAVLGLSAHSHANLLAVEPWLRELAAVARQDAPACLLVLGGLGVADLTGPLAGFTPLPGDARTGLGEIVRHLAGR